MVYLSNKLKSMNEFQLESFRRLQGIMENRHNDCNKTALFKPSSLITATMHHKTTAFKKNNKLQWCIL